MLLINTNMIPRNKAASKNRCYLLLMLRKHRHYMIFKNKPLLLFVHRGAGISRNGERTFWKTGWSPGGDVKPLDVVWMLTYSGAGQGDSISNHGDLPHLGWITVFLFCFC